MTNKIKSIFGHIKNIYKYNKDEDFNKFKANYLFSYTLGLCFLTVFGCSAWILKDIFILGSSNIGLVVFLRLVPCLGLPFIALTKNHRKYAWYVTLATIWIAIISNVFLDIYAHPADGLTGEGWITYFVFFFALSIVATNTHIIFFSELALAVMIIFTSEQYGGWIVYTGNIIRPVSTGLILDIGLILATITIRGAFIKMYDNEVILKNIAKQDTLTGLFNRYRLDDLISDKGALHRNSTIMLLDIDKFKEINDTYGHIAGDEAIKYAASVLMKSCRKNDVIVRFGGDEFVIVLDNYVDTDIIWGKIKENLLVNNKYNVTFSAGSIIGSDDVKLYSLLKKADKCAYYSKEHGRNRITKYEDLFGGKNK